MERNTLYKLCEKTEKYLLEKGISSDVYPYGNGLDAISVEINWGDWKHDHLRAECLLNDLGAYHVGSRVTEENGSDCYSAVHVFLINEKMFENI